jgi:hypothetical protein
MLDEELTFREREFLCETEDVVAAKTTAYINKHWENQICNLQQSLLRRKDIEPTNPVCRKSIQTIRTRP